MPLPPRNVVELWSKFNERITPPDLETITSLLRDFTNHRIEKSQLITSALNLFEKDEFLRQCFIEFLHVTISQEKAQEDEDKEPRNDEDSDTEEGEIREDDEASHLESRVESDQNPREDGDNDSVGNKKRKRGGILRRVLVEDDDDSRNKIERSLKETQKSNQLMRLTPSYRLILEEEKSLVTDKVLNNECVSVSQRKGGGDNVWGGKKLTDQELVMARCEEDMYEADMFSEALKSATEVAEKVMREEMRLEDVGVKFYRCVEQLYGGRDMAEIVREDHQRALPVIISRLKQKSGELKDAKEAWTRVWKKVFKDNSAKQRGSTAEEK